ncbi:MAG: RICIN domain-containing protein [Oscillospiraceae bacterium]|nr:RICIN domain-containing protein [Oscillospiraceae bacterium]
MMMKNVKHKAAALCAAAAAFANCIGMIPMGTAGITTASAAEYYYGDLDGSGVLDVMDLRLMKHFCNAQDGLSSIQQELCDLDESGVFDAADVKLMQDYILARIDGFPAGVTYEHQEPAAPEVYDGIRTLSGSRMMERLDRGVAAVRTGNAAFISWRLLASDEPDMGFNVYRTTDGETIRVNSEVLTGGTNFTDTTADLTKDNTYTVRTVYNGVEKDSDGSFTLPANKGAGAYYTVPIRDGGTVHFVWVGDFNGDGAYDYLIDRCDEETQKLEAYLNDGTYLWTIDMGPNSVDRYQIEPGAATIDVGMWDGATVYDIDCDGYAEVMLRIADGVTFGDGNVYSNSVTNGQAIAVIDGMTGAMQDSAPVPDDKIEAGPKACMMEIGYLDGVKPSLICWVKNRNDDKSFNSYNVAYAYENGDFVQQWKAGAYGAEAHNLRVADVDYDGRDEVLHMGYALNGDGSLRYTVKNVVHGDRWYVGSFCNANNGTEMMGYGIQQDNANGLLEYFYNASTGELIWEHYAAEGTADVARGNIGDIDPNYDGLEVWSFQGLYSMDNQLISENYMYPVFRLFWDGDLGSESYNEGKIEGWNYETKGTERIDTCWKIYGSSGSERGVGMLHADIIGDWREETVHVNYDTDELVIYTTTHASDERIYCLAQNPAYRNCMTAKGYYQANVLDYFLGYNMEAPETPDICYIGEAALDESAVYALRNVNSSRCMDVYKSGTADGTNIQQYGTVPGKANNTWTVKDAGDGYYYIISQLSDGKSGYMTVAGGENTDGANVEISSFKGDDSQKFMLKRCTDGSYLILTKCSNEKKCVEVIGAETGAGANVQQWVLTGSTCQNWYFEKIS